MLYLCDRKSRGSVPRRRLASLRSRQRGSAGNSAPPNPALAALPVAVAGTGAPSRGLSQAAARREIIGACVVINKSPAPPSAATSVQPATDYLCPAHQSRESLSPPLRPPNAPPPPTTPADPCYNTPPLSPTPTHLPPLALRRPAFVARTPPALTLPARPHCAPTSSSSLLLPGSAERSGFSPRRAILFVSAAQRSLRHRLLASPSSV